MLLIIQRGLLLLAAMIWVLPAMSAQLEEVIVTSQKRAEDIQDVPLSVTAIGGDDIKANNMTDLNTVAVFAPNFEILATPTFNFIYMRGLGAGYNRGFEQSVAVLVDEVFYGRPSYLSNGLLDLDVVEVLRGPQGTLFGKNSTAGALHMRTVNPKPEWGGEADLMLADRNYVRVRAAMGGPIPGLSDKFSFRVAALSDKRDGDIKNTTADGRMERNLDNQTLRTKLRWEPSDTLDIQLAATFATVDQGGSGTQLTKARPRHLAAMQVYDPLTSDDVYDDQTHQDAEGYVDRETWDATLTVNWNIWGGYILTNITNVAELKEEVFFDADFSPIPFLTLDNNEDYRQISQELRITSPPGRFEFVAGLYYFESDVLANYDLTSFLELSEMAFITGNAEADGNPGAYEDEDAGRLAGQQAKFRQDAEGTPPLETSNSELDQLATSYALFGQATWHATEHLALTLGLRVTEEEKQLDYTHALTNERTGGEGEATLSNPLGAVAFPVIQPGNQQFQTNRSRDESNVSPKLSLAYDWNEDVMSYVTVAKAFKSGGYNAQSFDPDRLEFEEESSTTYETGFKSQFLSGAARFNISAFLTDFEDLQVTAYDGVSFVVTNAATAKVKGVEFDAMLLTPWNILFSLTGAYIDAVYESFPTGPCLAEDSETVCDLSGRSLQYAPRKNATFTVGYDAALFDWPVRLHWALTAAYNDLTYYTVDLDPVDTRAPHTAYRGRIGIRDLDDKWHIMLFGTNLTDTEVLAGNNDVPTFVGSHFGGRVPTTDYQLEFGVKF